MGLAGGRFHWCETPGTYRRMWSCTTFTVCLFSSYHTALLLDLILIDYFNSYHNRLFHALMPLYSRAAVMRYNWFVMHIFSGCLTVQRTEFYCVSSCCLFFSFVLSPLLKRQRWPTSLSLYLQTHTHTHTHTHGQTLNTPKVNSCCVGDDHWWLSTEARPLSLLILNTNAVTWCLWVSRHWIL